MNSFTSSRKQRMSAAIAVAALAMSPVAKVNASGAVPSLKMDTYDAETAGKVVFIKFFAPWCGHCKSMATDWEQLVADYAENDGILIAEVDCTEKDGGEQLCDVSDVNGFPTLKYGDPLALEEYEGTRDYDALKDFAKEFLKPVCNAQNLELCDDTKKEAILKFQQMSVEELEKSVAEIDKELESIEDWFNAEEDKLQNMYEDLHDEHEKKKGDLKETKMAGLVKSVLVSKQQQSSSGSSAEL